MRAARAMVVASGITIAMMLALVGTAGAQTVPASGADACAGTTKVDLAAARVRLLNTDGERTFGPIAVSIPEGVYTVAMASWDRHDETQVTQPEEQWRVVADTGWSTPLTADIPDHVDQVSSTFPDLAVEAPISSITIVHKGAGIVNSVSPLCVGFTRTGDLPGVSAPTDDDGAVAAPDGDGGDGDGSDGDPDADDNADGTGEDEPVADGSATGITRPPADGDADGTSDATDSDPDDETTGGADDPSADGTSDSIEVEVEGQIELPPSLARTGPPLTTIAALVAAAFVLLGGYAVGWQRRLELADDPS